jgi:hypothetical protein
MELTEDRRKEIDIICDRITEGESLRSILKDNKPFSKSTFLDIVAANSDIADQYARAMADRQDVLFEEIITIADSQENDINAIQRNRLQIDARKWVLGKMNPKKYGDKIDMTSGGEKINIINLGDGEKPDDEAI